MPLLRRSAQKEALLAQMDQYRPAKGLETALRETGLKEIIKLAGNESRFGASPRVQEVLEQAYSGVQLYPDATTDVLAQRLAQSLGLQQRNIIMGSGLFELLTLIAQVVLEPGDEAIVSVPSFGWYFNASLAAGASVVAVPLKEYANDLDAIVEAITPATKLIWLCNPNNPTGAINATEQFECFMRQVPPHVIVALDEAYGDYVDDPCFPDALAYLVPYPNLIVFRTFSKVYGLAGLRVGYALAHEELIAEIQRLKIPINGNVVSKRAALAGFEDTEFRDYVIEQNRRGKQRYYEVLGELGLAYVPTQTNFIFFDTGLDSTEAAQVYLKAGILVRAGKEFGAPTWLRVTIGTAQDNERVLDVLRELIQGS
jgi:histidinol-phosphate aminotransferase